MEAMRHVLRQVAGWIRWGLLGCGAIPAGNSLGATDRAVAVERRNHEQVDLLGPEGIAVWQDHIFVSEVGTRRVVVLDLHGHVHSIAEIGDPGSKACVLGLAFDSDGTLYVAVTRINGGTVFKLPPGANLTSRRMPVAFRTQVGDPNGIAIDTKRRRLYVSDSGSLMLFGMDPGRVFRFDLDDRAALGRAASDNDVIARMTMPNGLALSPDGGTLYVAQTRRKALSGWGRVVALRTDRPSQTPQTLAQYRHWPDGLAYDERSGRLLLCLQKSSRIMTLDPRVGPKQQPSEDSAPRLLLGDRPCKPASVAMLSDGQIAFTDFWDPSLIRLMTGRIYHEAVCTTSQAAIQCKKSGPSSGRP